MGLQFMLGRSGAGKGTRCLEDIRNKLKKDPAGAPILYIVPDQMTFQQEYKLLKDGDVEGSIRAQVFSFSRLAWRVLQETGGGTKKFITSTGIQMMLRKIVEERTSDWRVFQKAIEKQGFIEQLEGMITEFKRYKIGPEDIHSHLQMMETFTHQTSYEKGLQDKLEDLVYIYDRLVDATRQQYIDSEDQLQLLAEKIPSASFLEGAEVYIDGFHSFTPQEYTVIEALLSKCLNVHVALTTGSPDSESQEELDLFHETKETYHTIRQMAQESGCHVSEDIVLYPERGRFQNRPALLHVEKHFDERPAPVYKGEDVPIQLAEAVHPRAEVEGAAQQILHLVRDRGYRYKDIAILVREPNVYHDLIQTLFDDYEIPVFIDEKRTMLNHPMIELVRSGLDVVEGDYRYDAVFRLLKTGFIPVSDPDFPLDEEAIDELENYVLEYGIRKRERWFSTDPWVYQRFRGFDQAAQTDEEKEKQIRINTYRKQMVEALEPFDRELREAKTISERAKAVYYWLDRMNVPVQLEKWRDYYDEHGEIERGREQEQVWDAILQLLDEAVEIAGDETISLQIFRSTIESGLEALTFAHVPPSMDHVIVGNVDRSRITGVKAGFLLGVTDGMWPMKPAGDGMISEKERELLSEGGLKLADGSTRQLLDDRFYIYLALTMAKDYLWLSYPLSNEEGKSKIPSQVIQKIEELFPTAAERLLLQDPDDAADAKRFITTPMKTRSALTAQFARYLRGYPMDDVWWDVLYWYMNHESRTGLTSRVLHSLFYQSKPVSLSRQTTERLFTGPVKTSVSQMETYHRCSYQYFSRHSLNLQERKTYKLDAPDIGQLFHEALKQITEWIKQEGRDFAELNQEQTNQYAEKATNKLAPILQNQILHSSNRHHYIKYKLQSVIARAAFVLSEQARKSRFSPVGLELGFGTGPDTQLPPLTLPLNNGHELMLRGRIDRVDRALAENELFLRIIDYKSSAKDLSLIDVYYGLALQMLAYLDVVLTNAEHWLGAPATPAGMLYFHVHNPMVSKPSWVSDDEVEKEIFKKFKMSGLLLENEQLVSMMDTSLEKGRSEIVPAGIKANGGFYKGSKTMEKEQFNDLRAYTRSLMVQAGQNITEGEVKLDPFLKGDKAACDYCPFRSVCQFDPAIDDHQFRKLKDLKEDDVIQQISRREENTRG
ncbi:helicase-exonuclease AddAB subunit AddB [Halobacillus massiliensis]|uniref:helicase-exonuclease AddAB subunit AddB n=1 Tax=Halobacillus massiliensis TaxID=1926286 RepID=UPI0009E19043|nr:helicase-exonuclease AddAB subunit AddB [Halobacillus massiliensis]